MPPGPVFAPLASRARGQAGKAEAMMITTGSVMTVSGSRTRGPAMLEIAVGDNSPGSHTVLWEQRLGCTVPCPKKFSGPFGVTRISRPQLPGSGATFSILRAFLLKWEILSQLACISLRHCLNNAV